MLFFLLYLNIIAKHRYEFQCIFLYEKIIYFDKILRTFLKSN